MRVIVRLRVPERPRAVSEAQRQAALSMAQQGVLSRLGLSAGRDRAGRPVKSFRVMPGLALEVDAIDLMDLLADPEVLDVQEDVAYPPTLLDSVPLIGGFAGTFEGYSGLGQVVAILDTGVDKGHPFLAGKVVSEACYSSSVPSSGITSLCPGGVTASTAPGSALNCDSNVSGCFHGTHVAGIAAGKGSTFSGVARDAQIMAIQVFSLFPSSACGGAPCIKAYTSDIIRGLERVHALRTSYSIAAANLSLGGGGYTSPCDGDPTKPVIDALHGAGIATVIASGNNGYTNAISAPGCISTAVTVGSTTKSDRVSSFSNSATFLDLLAPGSSIYSSVPGGTYGSASGTSMATPHVTGAWTVLKSAKPGAGVNEVLSALQDTGVQLLDARNNLSKPRIEVAEAARVLANAESPLPAAPSGLAASALSTTEVRLTWSDNSTNETGFRVERRTASSTTWTQIAQLGANVTSYTNSSLAANTAYVYRVRAYNALGHSPYSNEVSVTTPAPAVPAPPSSLTATALSTTRVRLTWTDNSSNETGFRIERRLASRTTWTQIAQLGANVTAYTNSSLAANTAYVYRVRAYNALGNSPYSNEASVITSR